MQVHAFERAAGAFERDDGVFKGGRRRVVGDGLDFLEMLGHALLERRFVIRVLDAVEGRHVEGQRALGQQRVGGVRHGGSRGGRLRMRMPRSEGEQASGGGQQEGGRLLHGALTEYGSSGGRLDTAPAAALAGCDVRVRLRDARVRTEKFSLPACTGHRRAPPVARRQPFTLVTPSSAFCPAGNSGCSKPSTHPTRTSRPPRGESISWFP